MTCTSDEIRSGRKPSLQGAFRGLVAEGAHAVRDVEQDAALARRAALHRAPCRPSPIAEFGLGADSNG